jgi:hypothetical protein
MKKVLLALPFLVACESSSTMVDIYDTKEKCATDWTAQYCTENLLFGDGVVIYASPKYYEKHRAVITGEDEDGNPIRFRPTSLSGIPYYASDIQLETSDLTIPTSLVDTPALIPTSINFQPTRLGEEDLIADSYDSLEKCKEDWIRVDMCTEVHTGGGGTYWHSPGYYNGFRGAPINGTYIAPSTSSGYSQHVNSNQSLKSSVSSKAISTPSTIRGGFGFHGAAMSSGG